MLERERRRRVSGAAFVVLLFIAPPPEEQQAPRRAGLATPTGGENLAEWTLSWLEGPVQVIATDQERSLYASLRSTEERLQFIRLFWERRDPRPRGPVNEFLLEFERRVAYTSEHFGDGGQAGWKTVFGRIVLVFGPPARTWRQLSSPPGHRPPILWSYDTPLPEIPPNEDLLFVFQRGRWRLMPPSSTADRGVDQQRRALEVAGMPGEIASDYERAMTAQIELTVVNPADYRSVGERVRATVAFPAQQIPLGWETSFGSDAGGSTVVKLELWWLMQSLIFHIVDDNFQTEMEVVAVLLDSDKPAARASEHVSVQVPAAELQQRRDEIVARAIAFSVRPGRYTLELTLQDRLLGYRTLYREALEVPRLR